MHDDEYDTCIRIFCTLIVVLPFRSNLFNTDLFTPRCWIFFEKLIVTQLVKR
jgi:hypothetical protein